MRWQLIIVFMLACLLLSVVAKAQTVIPVTGNVRDSLTNEPLPYASVILQEKGLATVTDDEGDFILHLFEPNEELLVTISFVGYNSKTVQLKKFLQKEKFIVRLKPTISVLEEIEVKSRQGMDDLSLYMKSVKETYQQNAPTASHIAKAHYCEKIMYKNKYGFFSESLGYSVFMGDYGKWSPLTNYIFFYDNTRQSHVSEQLALLVSKNHNTELQLGGSIGLNYFRKFEIEGPFSDENFKKFKFELDTIYSRNNIYYLLVNFKKGDQHGTMRISENDFRVDSIYYASANLWSSVFDKRVSGSGVFCFQYVDSRHYLTKVKTHYTKNDVSYWNDLNILIQKYDDLNLTEADYMMVIGNNQQKMQYSKAEWETYRFIPDKDFGKVKTDLNKTDVPIEQQFSINSGKQKNSYYNMDKHQALRKKLLRFF